MNIPEEILNDRSWCNCTLRLEIRSSNGNGSGRKTKLRLLESAAHGVGLPMLFLLNNSLAYMLVFGERWKDRVWSSSPLSERSAIAFTVYVMIFEMRRDWERGKRTRDMRSCTFSSAGKIIEGKQSTLLFCFVMNPFTSYFQVTKSSGHLRHLSILQLTEKEV